MPENDRGAAHQAAGLVHGTAAPLHDFVNLLGENNILVWREFLSHCGSATLA